jgi:hypothetical protein
LIENGLPLTQRNWITFAYSGDKSSINKLDGEELADAPKALNIGRFDELGGAN